MPSTTMNTINGNGRANNITGTSGDDLIRARGGDDTVNGGAGNDDIRAGRGDDLVFGGDGDDIIRGGRGNDTIDAGPGNDTVIGGDGADVFVVGPNTDTLVIKDFENGIDQIDVTALGINLANPGAGQHWGYLAVDGDDTIIEFHNTNGQTVATIVLENFDANLIDITDYII